MRIKSLDARNRPREKGMMFGFDKLNDAELLAILIQSGTRELNALSLGVNIIEKFGCISNLSHLSINDLTEIDGIGPAKGSIILAAAEFSKRMKVNATSIFGKYSIQNLFNKLYIENSSKKQEVVTLTTIDVNGIIKGFHEVSVGGFDKVLLEPRIVLQKLLNDGAKSYVLAHNHPSGESEPSFDDILLTQKLSEITSSVGISMEEHIIIGASNGWLIKAKKMISCTNI